MYTTGRLIQILNISRPTLYKFCKKKGIKPKKTPGGNYRYTELDLKTLLDDQGVDSRNVEEKLVNTINDVWIILKKLAEEVWGEQGERKLVELIEKNKNDIFILNLSTFKEM